MAEEKTRSKFQKYLDENLWPMIIVAFLTATVAFNVAVATIAVKHPPELMTEHYYEKGANLREVVNEKQATVRTGWKVTADMVTEDNSLLMLTVIDSAGIPCDSLIGTCSLYRPSNKHLDQEAKQILAMGAGRYAVKTEDPLLRGAWECVADLNKGEKHYKDRISFFVN